MAKILVADDHKGTRMILRGILEEQGHEIIECEDGGPAYATAVSERPDLILLDVQMPEMDGFEVLTRLRENPITEASRVVLLTSVAAEEGEGAGMELGVNHYIMKPIDADTVRLTVRVALREEAESGEKAQEVIKVENEILDGKLGGGIPLGSLTLIEGSSSSGKSVLCQHLTYGALQNDRSVAYFTTENTAESLVTQMGSIGLKVSAYIRTDRFRIGPVEEPPLDVDAGRLMDELVQDMVSLPDRFKIIVVDSITNLAADSEDRAIRGFFSSCKRLCTDGRTIILVAHSAALDEKLRIRLGALCDAHLKLGVEKIGAKLVKTLEVCKIHNAELFTGDIVKFDVEPGLGIRVTPISKVQG